LADVGRIRFFGGFRYAIFDWPAEDTVGRMRKMQGTPLFRRKSYKSRNLTKVQAWILQGNVRALRREPPRQT
jgi:hypothetical protein